MCRQHFGWECGVSPELVYHSGFKMFSWMASCILYFYCHSSSVWTLLSFQVKWRWVWDKCQDQGKPGVVPWQVWACPSCQCHVKVFLEPVGTLGFCFVEAVVTTALSCLWKLEEWLLASAASKETSLDAAVVILFVCRLSICQRDYCRWSSCDTFVFASLAA